MSLRMASIPGAQEILSSIGELADDPGRQRAFRDFFVSLPAARQSSTAKYLCNLVFQGGGVLGLAHVGFLAGLEHAGVRVAGVAGTSAGAIVATSLACARRAEIRTEVAPTLLGLISTMPMASFIDGPFRIRRLIKRILNLGRRASLNPSTWLEAPRAVLRIVRTRGLNPGNELEDWLRDAFAALGVRDNQTLVQDLRAVERFLKREPLKVEYLPVWENRDGIPVDTANTDPDPLLNVIATGLPPGLKFSFPKDLKLLASKYGQASPASFVRASIAIPGFFEPKALEMDSGEWRNEVRTRLRGLIAKEQEDEIGHFRELTFVDGGLLSNVPVDAFERMYVPRVRTGGKVSEPFPTVVVTLVNWRESKRVARRSVRGVFQDVMFLAQAVRLQRDRDAFRRLLSTRNDRYRIVEIDTTGFNWLNFTMSQDEMGRLFTQGLRRSKAFLESLK